MSCNILRSEFPLHIDFAFLYDCEVIITNQSSSINYPLKVLLENLTSLLANV